MVGLNPERLEDVSEGNVQPSGFWGRASAAVEAKESVFVWLTTVVDDQEPVAS